MHDWRDSAMIRENNEDGKNPAPESLILLQNIMYEKDRTFPVSRGCFCLAYLRGPKVFSHSKAKQTGIGYFT
jgi:hypothetical protein